MIRLSGNTIYLTKGDTLELQVNVLNKDGTPYLPSEGDVIRFAVKRKYSDAMPVLVKVIPNDTLRLRLEAEETQILDASSTPYVYDIEIKMVDGTVDTFIDRQKFYVTEEVY